MTLYFYFTLNKIIIVLKIHFNSYSRCHYMVIINGILCMLRSGQCPWKKFKFDFICIKFFSLNTGTVSMSTCGFKTLTRYVQLHSQFGKYLIHQSAFHKLRTPIKLAQLEIIGTLQICILQFRHFMQPETVFYQYLWLKYTQRNNTLKRYCSLCSPYFFKELFTTHILVK